MELAPASGNDTTCRLIIIAVLTAEILLSWQPGLPVAIVEAKDNKHGISDGLQQALGYAEILNVDLH